MSNTRSVTDLVSNQSTKLISLLDQLDDKLKELIAKMPADKQLELYDKLSKEYSSKLDTIKKETTK